VISALSFVSAGEPALARSASPKPGNFTVFMRGGWAVLRDDGRFRLFLYTQWLGGATLMALPFYAVAATELGLRPRDIAVLLAAQTAGALASNPVWGRIGDRLGKLRLLEGVAVLRLAPPLGVLALLAADGAGSASLLAFAVLFVLLGALVNGMTIGYLGYLMEISPDDRRPAYSAYFNLLASPAALLPLVGAAVVDLLSLWTVFAAAAAAAVLQLFLFRKLASLGPP